MYYPPWTQNSLASSSDGRRASFHNTGLSTQSDQYLLHVSLMSAVLSDGHGARGLLLFISEQLVACKNALCGNNISRDAALCTMELAC
jgi:hypothetical protein